MVLAPQIREDMLPCPLVLTTNVSEQFAVFIFKAYIIQENFLTSQKAWISINDAVKP